MVKFEDLQLSRNIVGHISKLGFETPSEIQEKTIPIILEGAKDVVGIAQTGTGKTGAFGLPIVDLLSKNEDGLPQTIILAPTRELALQVTTELEKFSKYKGLRVTTIYGGAPINSQIRALKKGVDIVVGTPGRVVDLLNRGDLNISLCKYLVLDEADEMLKMGFIEDIEYVLEHIPKKRRVYLFSATMPNRIKELSKKYMKKQVVVEIEKKVLVNELISQQYYKVDQGSKFTLLMQVLSQIQEMHGIIFCRTKADVDNVTNSLQNNKIAANCIHGDIAQNKREKILQDFKKKKIDILVATDVAARGIHVDNLSHVINYTLPEDVETYTHRIGRTGRAGNTGVAISFVARFDQKRIREIENTMKIKLEEKKPMSTEELEKIDIENVVSSIENKIQKLEKGENKHSKKAQDLANELLEKHEAVTIIQALLDEKLPRRAQNKQQRNQQIKGVSRLFIARGKVDKLNKKTLINYLERETGMKLKNLQDVKVCDTFSFVSIDAQRGQEIVDHFKKNKKGKRSLVEFAST